MKPHLILSRQTLVAGVITAVLSITSVNLHAAGGEYQFKADPTKVLGAENCKECHAPIFAAWEKTHHYLSFSAGTGEKPAMHRTDEAKEILKKMGMRSAKRDLCVQCHYTGQGTESRVKTISGTSCESCHGGGADWNKVHSNKEDSMALIKSEALGMIRPHNTYAVAANCFTCHTVPAEDLVNKGGHTAGSDFELVSWSQGEVRHNLQKTEGKQNTEASGEHKRVLYVVGRILDLEHSIRALAKATGPGTYATRMTERINRVLGELKKIESAGVAVGAVVSAVDAGQLKPGNAATLNGIADKIAKTGQAFASGNDGAKLAGVDGLIPGSDKYKGKPYQP